MTLLSDEDDDQPVAASLLARPMGPVSLTPAPAYCDRDGHARPHPLSLHTPLLRAEITESGTTVAPSPTITYHDISSYAPYHPHRQPWTDVSYNYGAFSYGHGRPQGNTSKATSPHTSPPRRSLSPTTAANASAHPQVPHWSAAVNPSLRYDSSSPRPNGSAAQVSAVAEPMPKSPQRRGLETSEAKDVESHTALHSPGFPIDRQTSLGGHRSNVTEDSEGEYSECVCPDCNKSFSNQSSLSKHLASHSKSRPYACDKCSKCFKRLDHLNSHKTTHRGTRPYTCTHSHCAKQYSDPRSLRRHMEKCTPNQAQNDHGYYAKRPRLESDAQRGDDGHVLENSKAGCLSEQSYSLLPNQCDRAMPVKGQSCNSASPSNMGQGYAQYMSGDGMPANAYEPGQPVAATPMKAEQLSTNQGGQLSLEISAALLGKKSPSSHTLAATASPADVQGTNGCEALNMNQTEKLQQRQWASAVCTEKGQAEFKEKIIRGDTVEPGHTAEGLETKPNSSGPLEQGNGRIEAHRRPSLQNLAENCNSNASIDRNVSRSPCVGAVGKLDDSTIHNVQPSIAAPNMGNAGSAAVKAPPASVEADKDTAEPSATQVKFDQADIGTANAKTKAKANPRAPDLKAEVKSGGEAKAEHGQGQSELCVGSWGETASALLPQVAPGWLGPSGAKLEPAMPHAHPETKEQPAVEKAVENSAPLPDYGGDADSVAMVRVGSQYQAHVEDVATVQTYPTVNRLRSELLWFPTDALSNEKVDEYCLLAGSCLSPGSGPWSQEYALHVLLNKEYHLAASMAVLVSPSNHEHDPWVKTVWSAEEQRRFEKGFGEHGKHFHLVQKIVGTKTIAQVIQYYYTWKKVENSLYRHLLSQHTMTQNKPDCVLPRHSPQPPAVSGTMNGNMAEGSQSVTNDAAQGMGGPDVAERLSQSLARRRRYLNDMALQRKRCARCSTQKSRLWRMGQLNGVICDVCHEYFIEHGSLHYAT